MITKKCKNCEEPFKTYKSKDNKFCCQDCYSEWCDKKKEEVCDECGSKFKRIRESQKYCSKECSGKAQRTVERIQKECPTCETNFETVDAYYGKDYCSVECANESFSERFKGKNLHSEEHKEYMSELMTGREITWKDEIKKNHWSKTDKAEEVIEKRRKTMNKKSEKELREIYDKISKSNIRHIEKNGHGTIWKHCETGYYKSKKTEVEEYYHSSYEKTRMEELDENSNVDFWTKDHNIVLKYKLDGRVRRYIPDFFIEYQSQNVLEEVKGWVRDEEMFDSKKKTALEFCRNRDMCFVVNFMDHLD